MSIHIEHLTSVVRVYGPDDSYEYGDEPAAVATLCRVDSKTIEIMAAKGRLSRTDLRAIAQALAGDGVRVLVIKRRTGQAVPYGRLTKTHGPFSYYEVATEDV